MKSNVLKQVLYSEEVDAFLSSISEKAKKKILYNIGLVKGGEIDNAMIR